MKRIPMYGIKAGVLFAVSRLVYFCYSVIGSVEFLLSLDRFLVTLVRLLVIVNTGLSARDDRPREWY